MWILSERSEHHTKTLQTWNIKPSFDKLNDVLTLPEHNLERVIYTLLARGAITLDYKGPVDYDGKVEYELMKLRGFP